MTSTHFFGQQLGCRIKQFHGCDTKRSFWIGLSMV